MNLNQTPSMTLATPNSTGGTDSPVKITSKPSILSQQDANNKDNKPLVDMEKKVSFSSQASSGDKDSNKKSLISAAKSEVSTGDKEGRHLIVNNKTSARISPDWSYPYPSYQDEHQHYMEGEDGGHYYGFDYDGYDGRYADEIYYPNMQRVKIKVVFTRINKIDTMAQQFDAEVYVQARWTEPRLTGLTEEELHHLDFFYVWDPKLKILNLTGGLEKDRLSMMIRYEDGEVHPVVTYMRYVKALFLEPLELEHFPFDVQELSIALSSDRPLHEIDLVPDVDSVSMVSLTAIQDNQEWTGFSHVEFTHDFRTTDVMGSSMYSVLVASCHVRRRLGFYMWNIFIIVFLILGLSLTILSMDPVGTDRLGVTMTLFLTCVAFKLVVKTTLPHISYLTYLDIYVVFTMMYLVSQAAENAVISHLARFRTREKVLVYDEIAQSILIGLLILFHASFLIYIQLTAFNRRRQMEDKERLFHLKKSSQNRKGIKNKAYPKPSEEDIKVKDETPLISELPRQGSGSEVS